MLDMAIAWYAQDAMTPYPTRRQPKQRQVFTGDPMLSGHLVFARASIAGKIAEM